MESKLREGNGKVEVKDRDTLEMEHEVPPARESECDGTDTPEALPGISNPISMFLPVPKNQ